MVAPNKPGSKDKPVVADTSRMQAADETARAADGLDAELNELKAKHDQYFLGLERFEPSKQREDLKKRLNALRTSHIRNAGLKFRVQAIWQKYLSYERMWLRIVREIEEGTYSRDLYKAKLRSGRREGKKEEAKKKGEAVELAENDLSAEGGSLDDALAAATQAAEAAVARKKAPATAAEPGTDPHLAAAKPASDDDDFLVRPATSSAKAVPPPPPPGSAKAAPPPPPPGAAAPPARNTGNFAALKGPPPPPPGSTDAVAKPVSQPGATRPPPPPPGSAAAPKAAPPPPPGASAAPKPVSQPSGARPPPPPPPGAAARPPGAGAPPPRPSTSAAAGALPDDKMRAIYNAYVSAKKQCKEPTDGITYESVAKTINSQTPELIKQHNAKAVDYKVVIKNGKATLKAVPRT